MRNNKLLCLIISVLMIFGLVVACQEEELSQEDLETRQKILEEAKHRRELRPEYLLTREEILNEDNEIEGVVKYSYDDRGNLINVDYFNDSGYLIESKEYIYNDEGVKVKRIVNKAVEHWSDYSWRSSSKDRVDFNSNRLVDELGNFKVSVATYEYDRNNQLIYYEKKDEDGKKIRSIKIDYHNNYHIKSQIEQRGDDYTIEKYYNREGKLMTRVEDRGYYIDTHTFFYDEYGNEIGFEIIRKNNEGDVIDESTTEIKHNEQNKVVSVETNRKRQFRGGIIETYSKREYKYDNEGNRIRFIKKSEKENADEIWKYEYDDYSNRIFSLGKDEKGEIIQRRRYKISQSDNITEKREIDLLNEREAKNIYRYDDYGNLVSVTERSIDGSITWNKRYYYKKFK